MNKERVQRRFVFACLVPAAVPVISSMMIFTSNVFCYSLYGKTGIVGDAPFTGLSDFKILFTDSCFIESMQNMILITVIMALFIIVLVALFTALLTRGELKRKNFFRVVFYIPNILSTAVTAGIFSTVYAPDNGLLNSFLEMIGFGMLQKQWVGDSGIISYSIIFALVWQAIGYHTVMYTASMPSIPENLCEAAVLEGVGKVKQFFMTMLPLIWNNIRMTLTSFVISTISLSFTSIQINTNGDLGSEAPLNYMYNKAFGGSYSYGTAIGIITFIFSFAPFGLLNGITGRDVLEFQEVWAMNKKKMSSHARHKIFAYVVTIVFAVSIIVPVAWAFLPSVKSQLDLVGDLRSMPTQSLWSNFVNAMEKAHMGEYLINSVFVTVLGLIFLLVLALPASYVLVRYPFKGKKFFNVLFTAGLFVNADCIVLPVYLILPQADQLLGVEVLLGNKVTLALVNVATSLPLTIYLLSGYFKTPPKAYEEAALIDGCGYSKVMTKIMIPVARPSIITVVLFQSLAFWNEHIMVFILMDKDSVALAVGLKFLMADQRSQANYDAMYAGLVIVMVPALILYICAQRKLTQGMSLRGLEDQELHDYEKNTRQSNIAWRKQFSGRNKGFVGALGCGCDP